MSKMPKVVAILTIVSGAIMIVVGATTYYLVHSQLDDEQITVSDDADYLAGDEVDGPFSAYAEADVIKQHALEAGGGLTYAELDQEDPARDTVMNASFLRASLFTSVVAFGVAAMLIGLGIIFVLLGLAISALDKRGAIAIGAAAPPTEPLAPPPPDPTANPA